METTVEQRIAASIAAYDEHARAYKEAFRKVRPMADIRRFAQLARDGALVLDVGCGPASDMRALRDSGVKPVGVDISFGALVEGRLLLPRDPLVRAPYRRLPFRRGVFGGLWLNGAFAHLPRGAWRDAFAEMMSFLDTGPVFFACIRGSGDLAPVDDEILGRVYRSDAHEDEVEAMLAEHGLRDIQVDVRPDPIHDRRRGWVVALARRV